MTKLEQAARQALEVLKGLKTASSIMNDGPDDSDVNYAECLAAEAWGNVSEAITALREALAEQAELCPLCGDGKLYEHTMYRCKGCGSELADARLMDKNKALAEQAEQEPLMITPGGGTFPFAVVGKFEQAEQRSDSERMEPVACKSVPIEPTEDMLLAAELSQPRGYRELYVAMISAAPVQQAEQEPGAIHQWRKKIPADQPWHDAEYKFAYARVDDFYEARTVYAAPVPVTTPDVCGEVCARAKLCYGCGKALDEANASWMSHDELKAYWSGYGNGKQKALSEPVAFKFPREPKPEQSMGWTIDYGLIRQIAEDIGDQEFIPSHEGIELVLLSLEGIYAAPVRTKDLTDDEKLNLIYEWAGFLDSFDFIDAVIAKDREKNR